MKPIDVNQRNRYFAELAIALKREGLGTMPPEDGLLMSCWTVVPSVRSTVGGASGIDART
ncbi:MAG: hypothetical protein VB064_08990 [Oscillospiraceae bacterium]|nr:hypothetical protein [Oscillospiraceae bacterium]